MKKLLTFTVAALLAMPTFADINTDNANEKNTPESTSPSCDVMQDNDEFISEETTEEGFITHYLNEAISKGMSSADNKTEVKYGRKVTDYASAPKFGGYFIGKYAYSSQEGQTSGNNSFSQRLMRFYVDGTLLKDFAYRIQLQTNNASFHVKDFFIEWKKFAEFKIKIGQYKRAFGLENPMNPWDVGVGDYSQLTKKLTGHSDYIGAESSSNGGRDQGIQIQGDLFPIGKDGHSLIHYQLMVSNGQGINTGDANSQKDITGTIHIQPIKGLFFGFYGWTGNYTSSVTATGASKATDVTVSRNRYLFFAKVEKDDWSFRAEYAHSTGHKISDVKTSVDVNKNTILTGEVSGTGRAQAWYATLGIPCNAWLKTWLKYDVYQDDATSNTTKTIWSICPNIQLHKNLMFQPQFNYVIDKTLEAKGLKKNYCELWLETYVRF